MRQTSPFLALIVLIVCAGPLGCSDDSTDNAPMRADAGGLDTGVAPDASEAAADGGRDAEGANGSDADAGVDAGGVGCETIVDEAAFDSYACDPLCQTGCGAATACYYGNNPVSGTTTSCRAPGDLGLGANCDFGTCAPGLQCSSAPGTVPSCEQLCVPGDPDGCPEGYECAGEPLGTCTATCSGYPADDCPQGQACAPQAEGGPNSCWVIDPDASHGDPCETFQDCNRDQLCITYEGRLCRDRCQPGVDPCAQGQCVQLNLNGEPTEFYACF